MTSIRTSNSPFDGLKNKALRAKRRFHKQATFLENLWQHVYELNTRLGDTHVFLLAGGIAFNVLLCIIPLVLVAIFFLGKIVDVNAVVHSIENSLSIILPPQQQSKEIIQTIVQEIHKTKDYSTTAGLVGAGILLWSSSALFSSLRTALNAIFTIPTPKFFLYYKLKDIALTIVLSLLILVSTLLSPSIAIIQTAGSALTPNEFTWFIDGFTIFAINVVSSFILFFFLFRFVPNKPQPWFIVIMGTITSVALWEIARVVFAWYVSSVASFGKFYGAFTVLVSAAIWIYYSALIILISAEISEYVYEQRSNT